MDPGLAAYSIEPTLWYVAGSKSLRGVLAKRNRFLWRFLMLGQKVRPKSEGSALRDGRWCSFWPFFLIQRMGSWHLKNPVTSPQMGMGCGTM